MPSENVICIKNMVCNRCVMAVTAILKKAGIVPLNVELGAVTLSEPLSPKARERLEPLLESYGFELIDDKRMRIVERIRVAVIEWVRYADEGAKGNLSDYLRDKCHHDYSFLSKLFSEINGVSIEKYAIAQKIERVKELLVYDEMTIGEIADLLRYSSAAHLSSQFKSVTGMSPSRFRRLKSRKLRPLDEI